MIRLRVSAFLFAIGLAVGFAGCANEPSRFCFGDGLCVEADGAEVLEDGQPRCEALGTCATGTGGSGGTAGAGGTSGTGGGGDTGPGDTSGADTDIVNNGVLCVCTGNAAIPNDTDEDCIPDDVEDANNNGTVDLWQNNGGNPSCFEPFLCNGGVRDGLSCTADIFCVGDGGGIADGTCDAVDVQGETDPLDNDTDDDGIPDGCEDNDRDGIADPGETQGFLPDSDCDGIDDGIEDTNRNGVYEAPEEMDPTSQDSDSDGILDGDEDVNGNGIVDPWIDADGNNCFNSGDTPGESDPRSFDSDGDQIPDQVEDNNFNGQCDPNETCAWNPDTDCDTLQDGREDLNHNGSVNSQETDPLDNDTDNDGIQDGLEDANGNGRWDPDETNALLPDTDGDSIPDGIEDANRNGIVDGFDDTINGNGDGCFDDGELPGELDPRTADTDGDGVPDNFEDRDQDGQCNTQMLPDPLDTSTLIRTFVESCAFIADTDCDGLNDGLEDVNRNGTFEVGELDSKRRDTDLDGLVDGCPPNIPVDQCEDLNNDGIVDSNETDPHLVDTDGDDLTDGCERNFVGGPTDPLVADSDGDGVGDGEEDGNHNCEFEPGVNNCIAPSICFETDPRIPDAAPTAGTIEFTEWSVCATRNLKEITFAESLRETHDYRLALEVEKEPTGGTCATAADCNAGEVCDNQQCAVRGEYFTEPFGRDLDSDGFNPNDLDDDLFGHIFQSPTGVVPDPGGPNGLANRDIYGFVILKEDAGSLDAFMQNLSTSLQGLPGRNASEFSSVQEIGNLVSRPAHDNLPSPQFPQAGSFRVNYAQRIFDVVAGGDRPALTMRNELLIDQEFAGNAPLDGLNPVPPSSDPVYGSINCNIATDPCYRNFTLYISAVQRLDQDSTSGNPGVVVVTVALTPDDRCGSPGLPACVGATTSSTAARLYNDRVARLEDLSGGSQMARFGAETGKICEQRDQQLAVADLLWVVDDSKSMQQTITRLQQASRDAQAVLTANSGIVDFRVALTTTNPSRTMRVQCQDTCDEVCDNGGPQSCSLACDDHLGCLKVCPAGCNTSCGGCADPTCIGSCISDPTVDPTDLDTAIATDAGVSGGVGSGDYYLPGGGGTFYYEDTYYMDCDGTTAGVDSCDTNPAFDPFTATGATNFNGIDRKKLTGNAGLIGSDANANCSTTSVCLTANADCTIPTAQCERLEDTCTDGPTVLASQMCDLIRSMGGLPQGNSASARPHSAPEHGSRSARRLLETMLPALPTDYSGPLDPQEHLRLQCDTATDSNCVECDPRVDNYCPVVPMVTIFLSDEEDFYFKDDCSIQASAADKRQLPTQCNWVDGDPSTTESCDGCDYNVACTDDLDCQSPATCNNGVCTCEDCAADAQCTDDADCPSGNCIGGICGCSGACPGSSTCLAGMCRCDRRDYCENTGTLYDGPTGYNPDAMVRNVSTGFSYEWPSDAPQCLSTTVNPCAPGDTVCENNTWHPANLAALQAGTIQSSTCNADPCIAQPDQASCEEIMLDIGTGAENYCVWDTTRCINRCAVHTKRDGSTKEEKRCDCDGDPTNASCVGTGDPFCEWVPGYVNQLIGIDEDEACQPKFPLNDCRACKRFDRKLQASEGVSADPYLPAGNQELIGFGDLGPVYAIVRDVGQQGFGGYTVNTVEDDCEGGFLTWGLGDGQGYRELAQETLGRTQNVCADSYANFMGLVISDIAALSAPYPLSGVPIAATLKVGIARDDGNGGFDYIPVPRSRTQGFFYDATVNTIAFKSDPIDGICDPSDSCVPNGLLDPEEIIYARSAPTVPRVNDIIFISYRFWKPVPCLEKCGDGEACLRVLCVTEANPPACPNNTDDDCPLGYICNLGNQQCEIDCTPGELIDVCIPDTNCGLCQTFNTSTSQCESVGDFCTCNPTGQQSCTPGVFSSCPIGFTCDENCGCVRVPGCDNGFTGDSSLAACQESLQCCLNWDSAQDICGARECSDDQSPCFDNTDCNSPATCDAVNDQTACETQPTAVCDLLSLPYQRTCDDDGTVCTDNSDCTPGAICLNPFTCDNDGSTCDVDADCGGGLCLSPCQLASPCEWGTVSGCDFAYPTCCQAGESPDCFLVPETGEANLFCRTDCECNPGCEANERCELIPGLNTCDCFVVPG